MFDLLVSNDEIASFVSFEVEGFKFLLEKMGLDRFTAVDKKENSNAVNENNNTSILAEQQSTSSRRFFKNEIASFIDESILTGQPQPKKKNNGIAAKVDSSSSQKEKIIPPFQAAESVLPLKIQPEEQALKAKFIKSATQIWNGTPANWSEHKAGVPKMNIAWT